MAGAQKQWAKGLCSSSGEECYCSVRKQNFSKSRWREKVLICPAEPHSQSGTACPSFAAEGERRRVPIGRRIWGQSFGRRLRQDRRGSEALVPGLWHWKCLVAASRFLALAFKCGRCWCPGVPGAVPRSPELRAGTRGSRFASVGRCLHRRGIAIPGHCMPANPAASSKAARLLRHRRRFAAFPHSLFWKKRMRRARCKRKREMRLYENIGR